MSFCRLLVPWVFEDIEDPGRTAGVTTPWRTALALPGPQPPLSVPLLAAGFRPREAPLLGACIEY